MRRVSSMLTGTVLIAVFIRIDLPGFNTRKGLANMIVLGVILLIIGFIATIPILWTVGIVLLIVGLVLEVLGSTGRAVGGRRHYY
jgi:Family of unknown function (DUF6131)